MTLYVQLSKALRIRRPGKADLVSERPVDRKGNYTDAAKPTLIEIGADCTADVDSLLSIGAIAVNAPPVEKPKGKEAEGG